MKEMLNKNHKKWPSIISIPVFVLLVIVFWHSSTWLLGVVKTYIGGLGMILTLPIVFCYVIGPFMDCLLDWYNKHFC